MLNGRFMCDCCLRRMLRNSNNQTELSIDDDNFPIKAFPFRINSETDQNLSAFHHETESIDLNPVRREVPPQTMTIRNCHRFHTRRCETMQDFTAAADLDIACGATQFMDSACVLGFRDDVVVESISIS